MEDSGKSDGDVQTALSNAFSREYLDRLREGSETSASSESEAAGPWELRHEEGVYPLFRSWEGVEHGDSPEGVFQVREAGLTFFAVRPAAGRDPLFRLLEPVTPQGFAVESAGQVVGHLEAYTVDHRPIWQRSGAPLRAEKTTTYDALPTRRETATAELARQVAASLNRARR